MKEEALKKKVWHKAYNIYIIYNILAKAYNIQHLAWLGGDDVKKLMKELSLSSPPSPRFPPRLSAEDADLTSEIEKKNFSEHFNKKFFVQYMSKKSWRQPWARPKCARHSNWLPRTRRTQNRKW